MIPIESITQALEPGEITLQTFLNSDVALLIVYNGHIRQIPLDNAFVRKIYGVGGSSLLCEDGFNSLRGNFPARRVFLQGDSSSPFVLSLFTSLDIGPSSSAPEVRAGGFVVWSEEKNKEDIKDLETPSASKLTPKKFKVAGREVAGFIVEDVEVFIPEAISISKDSESGETVKGWRIEGILAHLLQEFKDFKAKMEEKVLFLEEKLK